MESVLTLMLYPKGFSCSNLDGNDAQEAVQGLYHQQCTLRHAEAKGEKFVEKIKGKQDYQATAGNTNHVGSIVCMETGAKTIFDNCQ